MSFSEGKKMTVVDEGIIWCIYITCYVLLMSYMWAGMTFLPQSMISVMFPVTILYSICKRSIILGESLQSLLVASPYSSQQNFHC